MAAWQYRSMSVGYSGTPLVKKLGIREGHVVSTVDEPDEFRGLLEDLPPGPEFRVGA